MAGDDTVSHTDSSSFTIASDLTQRTWDLQIWWCLEIQILLCILCVIWQQYLRSKKKTLRCLSHATGNLCVFVYYSVFILGSHLEETLETLQKCGPQFLTATQPRLRLMKTESSLDKSRSVFESDNPGFKPRLHHLIGCVILCKSFKTAEMRYPHL